MYIKFAKITSRIDIVPAVDFLKLKNYGPIKEKEFKFSDNLNIITGKNGTGKSAVLQTLYGSFTGGREDKHFITDKSSIDIKLAGGRLYTEGRAYLDMMEFIEEEELSGHDGSTKKNLMPLSEYETFIQTRFFDYFNSLKGDYCLLIDDFGCALDKKKREAATEKLLATRGQVIVTVNERSVNEIPLKNRDKKFTMDAEIRKR